MRVTKLIREYVEKSVKEIYSPKINDAGADYIAERDELEDKIRVIVDETNERILNLLEEKGYESTYSGRKPISLTGYIIHREKSNARNKEINKLNMECSEKIRDILLTLELGGTKAELDRMLSELKGE